MSVQDAIEENAEMPAKKESLAGEGPETMNEATLADWLDFVENDEAALGAAEDNVPGRLELQEKISALEGDNASLAKQLAEARDMLLRKAADFENFRKRVSQEKQNAIEYANQGLLLDIIPVIDDFDRALKSAQASGELAALPAGKAMLEGIAMIEKHLLSQLENKWGLKQIVSKGEPFDPSLHEALFMEKSSDPNVKDTTVIEDFIKGYTLKGRVVRAAKVKVLMPENEGIAPPQEAAPPQGAAPPVEAENGG